MSIADKLLYLDETKKKLRAGLNEMLASRGEPLLTSVSTFREYADSIFTPSMLFVNGEQGAWYDPSDLSTLFQDAAGTIPVTTAGDPVGRMLDKSGRGNHAIQPTSAARPTYQTDGSLSWLQFDGVDDHLTTPQLIHAAEFSLYSAIANDDMSGDSLWFRQGAVDFQAGRLLFYLTRTLSNLRSRVIATATSAAITPTSDSDMHVYGYARSSAGNFELGFDDETPSVIATAVTSFLTAGCIIGLGAAPCAMKFAGMLVVSGAFNADPASCKSYLAKKAGVPL